MGQTLYKEVTSGENYCSSAQNHADQWNSLDHVMSFDHSNMETTEFSNAHFAIILQEVLCVHDFLRWECLKVWYFPVTMINLHHMVQ